MFTVDNIYYLNIYILLKIYIKIYVLKKYIIKNIYIILKNTPTQPLMSGDLGRYPWSTPR